MNSPARACLSCREAKVKCMPVSGRTECRACLKHSRACLPAGPRKPRLTTAVKISELESKIEVLTKALHQNSPQTEHAVTETHLNGTKPLSTFSRQLAISRGEQLNPKNTDDKHSSKDDLCDERLGSWNVDTQTASILFNHWSMHMQSFMPFIHIADDDTDSFSTKQPVTFLAMLTAASLSILPSKGALLSRQLNEELNQRVHIREQQSLDIIQALLIQTQYYASTQKSMRFAFTHQPYIASVMAFDLGLDRIARSSLNLSDDQTIEAARTWLATFCTATVYAVLLHRKRLVYEPLEVEAILAVLQNHPSKTPNDQYLANLTVLYQILNDSSMMCPFDQRLVFDDPGTRFHVTKLHQRLDKWKEQALALKGSNTALRGFVYHSVKLYIYRIAILDLTELMFSSNGEHKRQVDEMFSALSNLHFGALCCCVESNQEALRSLVSLPVQTFRNLPIQYLLWTVFGAVCTVKLAPFAEHLATMPAPNSGETHETRQADSTSQAILGEVVAKLDEVCQQGHMAQAVPILNCVRKLKLYYTHKRSICMNFRPSGNTQGDGNTLNLLRNDVDAENQSDHQIYGNKQAGIEPMRMSTPETLANSVSTTITADSSDFNNSIPYDSSYMFSELDDTVMEHFDLFLSQESDQWLELLR